jgi:hypothetical protein
MAVQRTVSPRSNSNSSSGADIYMRVKGIRQDEKGKHQRSRVERSSLEGWQFLPISNRNTLNV